jgi:hypothetical protein
MLLRSAHPVIYFVILVVAILAAYNACSLTENMDEYGYYLNTVKWIENYKTLPGTGLFNGRISINSSWHMSSAIFGYDFLYEGGAYDLNGLILCFMYLLSCGSAYRIYKKRSVSYASDMLLLAAMVFPFYSLVNSMDADYPTIFLGIFLISRIVRKIEHSRFLELDAEFYSYTLIALFLFTIKPFSGVYLIYPFIVALYHCRLKQRKPLVVLSIVSLLYIIPWMYRNYLLSGYLIYPIHFIDLFDVDWKLPIEYVSNTYLVISEFAKIELIRSDYVYTGVSNVSIMDWFPIWFHNNWELLIGKLLIIALPITTLSFIVDALRNNKLQFYYLKLGLLFVITFWFINFPAIRFGWAFVLAFLVLSGIDIIDRLKINRRYVFYVLLGAIVFSLSRNLYKISTHKTAINSLVYPERTPELTDYNSVTTNLTYNKSKTEYCYGKIPCVPVHNPWTIYLRKDDISDGFTLDTIYQ